MDPLHSQKGSIDFDKGALYGVSAQAAKENR
jgi:hypothetical protein